MQAVQPILAMALMAASILVGAEASSLRSQDLDVPVYMRGPGYANKKAEARANLGVLKGEALALMYTNCTMLYNDSKHIATLVKAKAKAKVVESEENAANFSKKIAAATDDDNIVDKVSGESRKMKWMDKRDDEKAEAVFYGQIVSNARIVLGDANKGFRDTKITKDKINKEMDDIDNVQLPMTKQVDDAARVHTDALMLWKQWNTSARDYNCLPVPVVNNVDTICETGNTKFSVKCHIACTPGYDSPGESHNSLRCRKEGKFGKELYGEWKGLAGCVGRLCGKPEPIPKSKTVMQEIRFPNVATYGCYEGYSQDGDAKGPKSFNVPCSTVGNFDKNASHQCERIKCGEAPVVSNTEAIPGKFLFSDSITYKCLLGHTLDETPGGLTNFSTSCQATGRFTQAQKCKPVRCGPAPDYDNTKLESEGGDKYYDDVVNYKCHDGYSTDQVPTGPKTFSLKCSEKGDFIVKGSTGQTAAPTCRPVSAGQSPDIPFGNAKPREMFFGESVSVSAETGYSVVAKPTEGLSFVLSVTTQGTFDGLQTFKPVNCGPPAKVEKATTSFAGKEAVFGDVLEYTCEDGFSTDKTAAQSTKAFAIQCEADADFSKVPDLGSCVNIDDCAEHTCGPHGDCVDHLNNYTCACASGYEQTWDETTKELLCGNVDDCGAEACGVGECKDGLNTFECICPAGYKVFGEAEEKTCVKKICGNPPSVSHAGTSPTDDADEKKSYQDEVLYQCDVGYTLNGKAGGKNHFDIECQADKKFTATKECKAIQCGNAPTVEFATKSPATATFNESIRYTCADGYSVDGTPTGDKSFGVSCLVTGLYSEASKCRPVNCGVPDDIPNAARPSGSLVYKESVTFTCFEGYTLDGKKAGPTTFDVNCHADGALDALKACIPRVCGAPPSSIHALHASTADEGAVSYPRQTEVTCRDGYTVGGSAGGNTSFNVQCKSSGDFQKYDKEECLPVRCAAAPELPNATLDRVWSPHKPDPDSKLLNFEEKAFYKCKPGFSAGGEPDAPRSFKVECLPSGELSMPPPDMQCRNINDCERHSCGPEGTCVDLIGPSPAYTCDCQHGFDLRTKPNGEKTCGNTDDCKEGACGIGVCKDLVGDYTCICPTGHYIGLGPPDGVKTCVPVKCSDSTPELENGQQESSHSGVINFPTTLRYKCDQGYSIDGSVAASKRKFQVHCKPEGKLAGLMECQKITCGTPRVLPFTNLISPTSPRRSIEYAEVVKYECFNGYTVGGKADGATSFTVDCPDDGVLTDPEVCEPVKCGLAPRVAKSRAGVSGDVFFGMHLEYSCDQGYTLDATPSGPVAFSRNCQKDGTFTAITSAQPCKPISGGKAPTVANAVMTEYAGKAVTTIPDIQYPDGLEYKCKAGFSENGSPNGPTKISSRVNTLGLLSPALPSSCLEITFTIRGKVKNSLNGRPLAGASIRVEGSSAAAQTSNGFFTLSGVKPGTINLVYERDGYIKSTRAITMTGDVSTGGVADISMSPKMRNDQWRAVIKWGRRPSDLDSYAKWGWSKACWYNRVARFASMKSVLEHDDTNSYGPETVFFSGVGKCTWGSYYCDIKYMINDYNENGNMKDVSGAEVTLYTGETVAGTWKIASCANSVSRDGNWWHVFTLDGQTNKLKWSCDQPASFVQTPSIAESRTARIAGPAPSVNYDSYVGPFPGRYFRHSMHAEKHEVAIHEASSKKPSAHPQSLAPPSGADVVNWLHTAQAHNASASKESTVSSAQAFPAGLNSTLQALAKKVNSDFKAPAAQSKPGTHTAHAGTLASQVYKALKAKAGNHSVAASPLASTLKALAGRIDNDLKGQAAAPLAFERRSNLRARK